MINLKELAKTGLFLLEEAVLAILYVEQSGLEPKEISERIGIGKNHSLRDFNVDSTPRGNTYPIVNSLLLKLEKDERVERIERDKPKRPKWRLTETENRERGKLVTHYSLDNNR